MVRLTEASIRKRAEHNDGILADLEEISLHQMEVEKIETIGTLCRKLRILYLQNNIIPKIEGLHHLKDLQYLNLTLNNIKVIEGLSSCEFLSKLDLTVNFIDVDALEESMNHLRPLLHLKELFLTGNPCQDWPSHRDYIIHCLPQLRTYDGKEITRSERILAAQKYPSMRVELRELANKKREEKGLPQVAYGAGKDDDDDDEGKSEWTPEERTRMYREMAEQKAEQEKSRSHMEPKSRDFEKEQQEAIERARAREAAGEIRQCNEGRWEFRLDDDAANVMLTIALPRFLDTSLIDVDPHPHHITVVIKGKVLRLKLPEEVKSDAGTAKRSAATGDMLITLPKARPARSVIGGGAGAGGVDAEVTAVGKGAGSSAAAVASGRVKRLDAPKKLGDELLAEASKAVSTRGIVSAGKSEFIMAERTPAASTAPVTTSRSKHTAPVDDDDVPPLE